MKNKRYSGALIAVVVCVLMMGCEQSEDGISVLREKARKGDAEAQYNLGVAYSEGSGVRQNYKEAIKWYRLAARQGLAVAQYNLGYAFYRGRGTPQNYEESTKWYRLAAEQGFTEAQFNLGVAYDEGAGVEKNSQTALKWYRSAAERGHAEAQHVLGFVYFKVQDHVESVKWMRMAAEQGHLKAEGHLGAAYFQGEGVPKDIVQAYAWICLAARDRDPDPIKGRRIVENEMTDAEIKRGKLLAEDYTKKYVQAAKGVITPSGGDPLAISWAVVGDVWVRNNYANGDITMSDRATGNMWVYSGSSCGIMTWSDAMLYCDTLTYAGYSDWRLPTVAKDGDVAELDALFKSLDSTGEPFARAQRDTAYWSGTSLASHTGYAWRVYMNRRSMSSYDKTGYGYVWPVRGGQ